MTEKQLVERLRAFPLLARQAVVVQIRLMAKFVEKSRDKDEEGVLYAMPELAAHLYDQLLILETLPDLLNATKDYPDGDE